MKQKIPVLNGNLSESEKEKVLHVSYCIWIVKNVKVSEFAWVTEKKLEESYGSRSPVFASNPGLLEYEKN
jgi:hypothetical protein